MAPTRGRDEQASADHDPGDVASLLDPGRDGSDVGLRGGRESGLYSITFTAVRRTRAEYRLDQHRAALGLDDTAELHVIADWEVTGIGYRTDAERTLAALLAELHLASCRLDGQSDDPLSPEDEAEDQDDETGEDR